MPARKTRTPRTAVPPPASKRGLTPRKTLLVAAASLVAAGLLFFALKDRVTDAFAGPRVPLPRVNLGLQFGTGLKDVMARFPGSKDRAFNNDPLFRILTLKDRRDMPEGAAEAELIFFEGALYFVSAKWEDLAAAKVPVETLSQQFRRWRLKRPAPDVSLQGAGRDTVLGEWYFDDGATEMVLRDLRFNQTVNRWMDLRDASNEAAQRAFAPYRFDLQ
jgi:hypothetical protein